MRRLFLSDVHLMPSRPQPAGRLRDVLCREAPRTDEIYILGDLFDYWFGPKHLALPDYRPTLDLLRQITASGVRVVFLRGNRDFYMRGFEEATGVTVCPRTRTYRLQIGDRRVGLCHGNYLDTRPRGAHVPEELIRSRLMAFFYTRLPVPLARWGATAYRDFSARNRCRPPSRPRRTFHPSLSALVREFRKGYDVLVAGHFHHAAKHSLIVDGQRRTLFALGDWSEGPSYLIEQDGTWRLCGRAAEDGG